MTPTSCLNISHEELILKALLSKPWTRLCLNDIGT